MNPRRAHELAVPRNERKVGNLHPASGEVRSQRRLTRSRHADDERVGVFPPLGSRAVVDVPGKLRRETRLLAARRPRGVDPGFDHPAQEFLGVDGAESRVPVGIAGSSQLGEYVVRERRRRLRGVHRQRRHRVRRVRRARLNPRELVHELGDVGDEGEEPLGDEDDSVCQTFPSSSLHEGRDVVHDRIQRDPSRRHLLADQRDVWRAPKRALERQVRRVSAHHPDEVPVLSRRSGVRAQVTDRLRVHPARAVESEGHADAATLEVVVDRLGDAHDGGAAVRVRREVLGEERGVCVAVNKTRRQSNCPYENKK